MSTVQRHHKARRASGHLYVNAKKAAEIIGISQATFYLWQKKGAYLPDIEKKDFGARTFYAVSSLRKLANSYTPHQRIKEAQIKASEEHKPHNHPDKRETDAILDVILEVLTQLQKTIAELKKKD